MDWQRLFQSHILDRGFQYYKQGLVEDFCEGEDFIQATVQGSEAYDVLIDIADGEILDMNCDCPYAAEGNYCKHMAAVLFYMEEADQDGIDGKKAGSDTKIRSEVVSGGEDFLTDILKNDEKLFNRFRSAMCCKISPSDMKRYKNQIDGIFRHYGGRYGFVDYYNAGPFNAELEEFLDHDIRGLLGNRELEEAFELTNYIFVKTGNQDIDMVSLSCSENL